MKRSAPALIAIARAVALAVALGAAVFLPGAGSRASAAQIQALVSRPGNWIYINPQLALVIREPQPSGPFAPRGSVQGYFMVRLKKGGTWHRVDTRPLPSLSQTSTQSRSD